MMIFDILYTFVHRLFQNIISKLIGKKKWQQSLSVWKDITRVKWTDIFKYYRLGVGLHLVLLGILMFQSKLRHPLQQWFTTWGRIPFRGHNIQGSRKTFPFHFHITKWCLLFYIFQNKSSLKWNCHTVKAE